MINPSRGIELIQAPSEIYFRYGENHLSAKFRHVEYFRDIGIWFSENKRVMDRVVVEIKQDDISNYLSFMLSQSLEYALNKVREDTEYNNEGNL